MNKNRLTPITLLTTASALLAGWSANTIGAPGTITQSPLYLSSGVQPNIFFMADDSGSMDWEVLTRANEGTFYSNQPDGTNRGGPTNAIQERVRNHSGSGSCTSGNTWQRAYLYGVDFKSNNFDSYDHVGGSNNSNRNDCKTADDKAWRFRNSDFNALYFNPHRHYVPWCGKDEDGNDFSDMPVTHALDDPYHPHGAWANLLRHNSNRNHEHRRDRHTSDTNGDGRPDGFWFFTWSDDGDGLFENGEQTGYRIADVTAADIAANDWRNPDGTLKTVAQLQQDFANWFSYYRKREYILKAALSHIACESNARMGFSTLHNRNRVGTPIDDMSDNSKKDRLLDNLFHIDSNSNTPLRQSLKAVGRYFENGVPGHNRLFSSAAQSPIESKAAGGECQQNFAILMSDGYWNGGNPHVGNTDSDGPGPYDGGSYADGVGNTLADVAMHYYERDLRPGYNDLVPVIPGLDDNTMQHLVTYTVAFGLSGTITADPPDKTTAFNWPNPITNGGLVRVDDMRHAAWNGRGKFLSANDPATLIAALNAAVRDISVRSGSAAAVSFNSTSLQTDTLVYQARFDSTDWRGDLWAWDISSAGIGAKRWEAAALLEGRDLSSSPRNIITFDGSGGINFKSSNWNALTTAQKADLCAIGRDWTALPSTPPQRLPGWSTGCYLDASGNIVGDTTLAKSLIDYFDGDHGKEGTQPEEFRPRIGYRLGDIIHSGPLYVGKPGARYPDSISPTSKPYSAFVAAKANRPGMVYVGSNDGMLHAFDSSENLGSGNELNPGQEVFAYIPRLLFTDKERAGLHYLAEQQSPNTYQHRYYVDLSANAADIFINGDWHTYLLGGLRAGGKGIFALDITDPMDSSAHINRPKWEFTHNELGYSFSEVRIAKMNNGRWAAILGNGYNSDPLGSGTAQLFIIDMEDGSIIRRVDTGAGSMANGDCGDTASDCNGLSTPAIADLNGDGTIDRIWAGDLQGNLWAFDVSDSDKTKWASAYGAAPLFQACSGSPCTASNRQPITSRPAIARHGTQKGQATAPNIMVFFGTGQYIAQGDNTTTGTQSFYGVWDVDTRNTPPHTVASPPLTRNKLVRQDISLHTTTVGGVPVKVRSITNHPVDYSGATPAKFGWYMDLPDSKERTVVTPHTLGKIVFFNTLIPTTDACGGGSGWLMSVKQSNGGEPDESVIDVDGNGTVADPADIVAGHAVVGVKVNGMPTESRFISNTRVTATSRGNIKFERIRPLPASPPSRMSWTDLID